MGWRLLPFIAKIWLLQLSVNLFHLRLTEILKNLTLLSLFYFFPSVGLGGGGGADSVPPSERQEHQSYDNETIVRLTVNCSIFATKLLGRFTYLISSKS